MKARAPIRLESWRTSCSAVPGAARRRPLHGCTESPVSAAAPAPQPPLVDSAPGSLGGVAGGSASAEWSLGKGRNAFTRSAWVLGPLNWGDPGLA